MNEVNCVLDEISQLLESSRVRPYVFRTRLERTLIRASHFANNIGNSEIKESCRTIKEKLRFCSDQSNHGTDGTLASYSLLKEDIEGLRNLVEGVA